jgi:hypothetical protein
VRRRMRRRRRSSRSCTRTRCIAFRCMRMGVRSGTAQAAAGAALEAKVLGAAGPSLARPTPLMCTAYLAPHGWRCCFISKRARQTNGRCCA